MDVHSASKCSLTSRQHQLLGRGRMDNLLKAQLERQTQRWIFCDRSVALKFIWRNPPHLSYRSATNGEIRRLNLRPFRYLYFQIFDTGGDRDCLPSRTQVSTSTRELCPIEVRLAKEHQ